MRRYWLNQINVQDKKKTCDIKVNSLIEIKKDLFHHIFKVCRQSQGDQFEILTDGSQAFLVEVVEVKNKSAQVKVLSDRVIPPLHKPHIELCVSLPKYRKFEAILEKSVELGVYKVRPFVSDFSFIQNKKNLSDLKLSRWKRQVESATQQSGRGELMNVEDAVSFSELLREFKNQINTKGLFAYEGEGESLKASLTQQSFKESESIWVFVGSEGGFSQKEVEYFKKFDLNPLSLGEQVLKVETACLALVAVIKYECLS